MSSEKKTKGNEVLIAVIGLIGVLVTAGFSNWDRLFPESNVIEAKYSGYRPTDNYETELRHYFNVSGTRLALDNMQKQLTQNFKMQLSSQYPEDSDLIKRILDIAQEEAITIDEMLSKLLPVYKNHFTLQEIQELNRFYSTEAMQNMTKKLPLIAQEAAPIQVKLISKFQNRYLKRIEKYID